MYIYRDVTEALEGTLLPSEALQLNGEYIEDLIPGYRTLHVKGREALSPELETFETGARDGSTLKKRRFPARIITVTYKLSAESDSAFREAYNALAGVLNVEDAQLIFNDEQDKYYTGTPSAIGEVEPGRNSIVSSFDILCVDPFKYSLTEYEVTPTVDDGLGFVVNYNGTYNSFPELEADFYREDEASDDGEVTLSLTGNGDCGYVAFFNDQGKIVQLGDPEETDGEALPKSQTLISSEFKKTSAWGKAAKALWSVNSGDVISGTQTGSPGIAKASDTEHYLTGTSFGSGSSWHGPSISRAIPTDAAGDAGATNFTVTVKHKMCIGSGKNDVKQKGAFQCVLTDADSKIVAGFNIYKSASGKKANLRFYVNGKIKETISINLSYYNKYFGSNRAANKKKKIKALVTNKTSTITKSGNTVTFSIGGITRVYRDDDIASTVSKKVTLTFFRAGTSPGLKYNGIYWVKFVKDNCDTYRDIPNKFGANDIVIADCKEGEIYLNNNRSPELGALGNDWEEFCLTPGVNQIGVAYSDWVSDEYAPTFKLRYREVFL